MTIEKLMNMLGTYKNGTLISIEYETAVPVKACYKDLHITRKVKKLVRLGVDYHHIASVIANSILKEANTTSRKNPYTWDLDNIIAKNASGDIYLQFANMPKHNNTVSCWYINGCSVGAEDVVEYVLPSYAASINNQRPIQKIHIENIIKIG